MLTLLNDEESVLYGVLQFVPTKSSIIVCFILGHCFQLHKMFHPTQSHWKMRRGFLDFSGFVIKLIMEILTAEWKSVQKCWLLLKPMKLNKS